MIRLYKNLDEDQPIEFESAAALLVWLKKNQNQADGLCYNHPYSIAAFWMNYDEWMFEWEINWLSPGLANEYFDEYESVCENFVDYVDACTNIYSEEITNVRVDKKL